jgi:hypothetical protein
MSDLLKLAARCEAATGPDRELDVELAVVAGLIRDPEFERGYFYGAGNNCDYVLERGDYDHGNNAPELPYYTASLDAAMTLRPDGHTMASMSEEDTHDPHRKCAAEYRRGFKTSYDKAFPARAATLPLALCAAALRAQAMQSEVRL